MNIHTQKRKCFPETESPPGEEDVMLVEMTTKDRENYINFIHNAAAGFGKTDSSLEWSSTVCKVLSNTAAGYREIIHERKTHLMGQTSLLSYFNELSQPPRPLANTTLISQQPSVSRQHPPPAKKKNNSSLKTQMVVSIFSNKPFLKKNYVNTLI